MTFLTPPAPRIPYDIDGTVVVISRTGDDLDHNPFEADYLTKANLNSSQSYGLAIGPGLWDLPPGGDEVYYTKNFISLLLPRPTDIKAWFFSAVEGASRPSWAYSDYGSGGAYVQLQTSTDTTNGQDGTWSTVAEHLETDYVLPHRFGNPNVNLVFSGTYNIGNPAWPAASLAPPNPIEFLTDHDLMYRDQGPVDPGWTEISGANGVTGIRLFFPRPSLALETPEHPGGGFFTFMAMILHLYGTPSAVSGNRLALMNATGSALVDLTIGDMDFDSSVTRVLRVRNLSSTETAAEVRITAEQGIPLFSPPSHFVVRFSLDEMNWLPSLRLGDIPPGELSPDVFLRVDPLLGMVGLHFARVHALAGEWS